MASLSAKGASKRWCSAQENVKSIFNAFAVHDDQLDADWDGLPETVLCDRRVYQRFAHYLLHTHRIANGENMGERLSGGTPANYLSIAINLAADKFKAVGSDATKRFFNCLDTSSTSDEIKWLRGLKANMKREIMERARDAGDQFDTSEGARW